MWRAEEMYWSWWLFFARKGCVSFENPFVDILLWHIWLMYQLVNQLTTFSPSPDKKPRSLLGTCPLIRPPLLPGYYTREKKLCSFKIINFLPLHSPKIHYIHQSRSWPWLLGTLELILKLSWGARPGVGNFCQWVWKCDDLPSQMSLSAIGNHLL